MNEALLMKVISSAFLFTFTKRINMYKYLILTILIIIMIGCSSDDKYPGDSYPRYSYEKLNKTFWLLGNWQHITEDGINLEHWERKNDSTFIGSSCVLIGQDTASAETLVLEQRHDTVTYNPTVRNQNHNQSVKFTLTKATDSLLVFENLQHDFPQKISYGRISEDSIIAEISGKLKGKETVISFPYTKVKPAL